MYADRVLLPRYSNREDFLLTVSLFDDDLNQPIKIDGCATLAGTPFVGSNWTVTDGAVIAGSVTTITIPVFPIGNQLSVLSLQLNPSGGGGFPTGISPGDPITISDAATGLKNSMVGYVISYVVATGKLVVQIGVTFQFEIRRCGPRNSNIDDFTPFFYTGQVLTTPPILSASLGNGITHIDTGVFQIRIPEATFRQLERRTYQAGLTMTDSIDTREIFVAALPVGYGGVTN